MRKRLWDLAKSRIEIATILPGHRHKVLRYTEAVPGAERRQSPQSDLNDETARAYMSSLKS